MQTEPDFTPKTKQHYVIYDPILLVGKFLMTNGWAKTESFQKHKKTWTVLKTKSYYIQFSSFQMGFIGMTVEYSAIFPKH